MRGMNSTYCNRCERDLAPGDFYVRGSGPQAGQYMKPCKWCKGHTGVGSGANFRKRPQGMSPHFCQKCGTQRTQADFYLRKGKPQYPCKSCYDEDRACRKFNITPEEYRILRSVDTCGLCGTRESLADRMFAIDHDHATGEVRGVLCHHCNVMLGYARDSADVLRRAADWVDGAHPGKRMVRTVLAYQ